jgi:oligopeptide/dipeptide ABC transporter ATP-binding protein
MSDEAILAVRDLSVAFPTADGVVHAAEHVSFELARGETLGVVGESGSGKSVTLRAIMGLIQPPGMVLGGEAWLAGRDLLALSHKEVVAARGRDVGMIFQDPGTSLDPVVTIGAQLTEVLRRRAGLGRRAAKQRAVELLTRVGIPSAARRLAAYPHELSGGMRQRVMIALTIAVEPKVLLADEPTTALDVTVQDQILALLADLQAETGMAIVLVSHDLGVVAQASDQIAVMYAGRIVEHGLVDDVLDSPRHPYTRGLMDAVPGGERAGSGRLATIGGEIRDSTAIAQGCPFAPRCAYACEDCAAAPMVLDRAMPEHGSACIRTVAVAA